jgi:hypothetical protein
MKKTTVITREFDDLNRCTKETCVEETYEVEPARTPEEPTA